MLAASEVERHPCPACISLKFSTGYSVIHVQNHGHLGKVAWPSNMPVSRLMRSFNVGLSEYQITRGHEMNQEKFKRVVVDAHLNATKTRCRQGRGLDA